MLKEMDAPEMTELLPAGEMVPLLLAEAVITNVGVGVGVGAVSYTHLTLPTNREV